jgi:hypothetical protein
VYNTFSEGPHDGECRPLIDLPAAELKTLASHLENVELVRNVVLVGAT